MAMKKVYHTVNGQLIAEETPGGGRVDYLTDALGNVTATVNQSAQVVNTYRYKPYGGLLAKTGGGSDPAFQWVGSEGYRQTGKSYSEVYIRARHYSPATSRWTTKDPLQWSTPGGMHELQAYDYAGANPLVYTDPTGLEIKNQCPHTIHTQINNDPNGNLCHCVKDCWHELCCSPFNEFQSVVGTLRRYFYHAFPRGSTNNNRRREILFWALACVVPQESRCDPKLQLSHKAGAKGWYQIIDDTWWRAFHEWGAEGWLNQAAYGQRCHPGLNTQVAVAYTWFTCRKSQATIYDAVDPWEAAGTGSWRSCFRNFFGINNIPRRYREHPEQWLPSLRCPKRLVPLK